MYLLPLAMHVQAYLPSCDGLLLLLESSLPETFHSQCPHLFILHTISPYEALYGSWVGQALTVLLLAEPVFDHPPLVIG